MLEKPNSTNIWGIVVHASSSCYLGGIHKEDHGLRLAIGKNMRPYLKNN
jgi:hypothetical protein